MSILIGADIVPTKSNYDLFEKGTTLELVGQDLMDILNKADFRIFNLEVPLTDYEKPIAKCGPNLIAPYNTIKGLKSLGVDLFTLANNHILDQDVQGLNSTTKALDEVGIDYLGVGNSPIESAKPYMFEYAGRKIGVYACAEHEFSIVSDIHPGVNPYDPLESFDHVSNLKRICDYVIVLYHGGKEHYRYPSPNLQKVFRKFADKGADLIIAQHTHCIGCMEKYNGSTLIYGQGNFLFDDSNSEFWKTSLLIGIDENMCISYIPLEKHNNVVRLANKNAGNILDAFYERSEQIKDPEFIKNKYSCFAEEYIYNYLCSLRGHQSFFFRAINKISKNRIRKLLVNCKYRKQQFLTIQNYVECEAHRELLLKGLKKYR